MEQNKKTCNCIEKVTKTTKEHIKDSLKDVNIAEWENEGRFQNYGYNLSGGDSKIGMPFLFSYIRRKNNGEPEKRVTNEYYTLYPTYCPFCGRKYISEKKEKTTEASASSPLLP